MTLLKLAPLFVIGASMEGVTHLCLKKGASAHCESDGIAYYLQLLRNRWVIAGLLTYLIDNIIWLFILSIVPLSIAFPLTGMQKVFIIFFSVLVLRENVSRAEWWGIGITAAGIGLIVHAG